MVVVPAAPPSLSSLFSSGLLLGVVLLGGLLTGCVSSAPSRSPAPPSSTTPSSTATSPSSQPERVASDLRAASAEWAGVPHEWGGTTKRGVDCSGLVQNLYADVFALDLPRTTEQQADAGTEVRRRDLQPGDLVFFRPGRKKRHVGVYLSDGEFVHASASSGVTVSRLHNPYWDDHWWQARRVLRSTGSRPDTSDAPAHRTGW